MTKDLSPEELAEVVRFGIHPELSKETAIEGARAARARIERRMVPRLGLSLTREMDRDILALRQAAAALDALIADHEQVEKHRDEWQDEAQRLANLLDDAEAVEEFAIRWDTEGPGYPRYSRPKPTREDAEHALKASVFAGRIVKRTVQMSEWVDA